MVDAYVKIKGVAHWKFGKRWRPEMLLEELVHFFILRRLLKILVCPQHLEQRERFLTWLWGKSVECCKSSIEVLDFFMASR